MANHSKKRRRTKSVSKRGRNKSVSKRGRNKSVSKRGRTKSVGRHTKSVGRHTKSVSKRGRTKSVGRRNKSVGRRTRRKLKGGIKQVQIQERLNQLLRENNINAYQLPDEPNIPRRLKIPFFNKNKSEEIKSLQEKKRLIKNVKKNMKELIKLDKSIKKCENITSKYRYKAHEVIVAVNNVKKYHGDDDPNHMELIKDDDDDDDNDLFSDYDEYNSNVVKTNNGYDVPAQLNDMNKFNAKKLLDKFR